MSPTFRGFCFCLGRGPTSHLIDQIGRDSITHVVTSPPYKTPEYSLRMMEALGRVLGAVMAPAGRIFLNFGQAKGSYERPSEARDALLLGADGALALGPEIAWVKSIAIPEWRKPILDYLDSLDEGKPPDVDALRRILKGPGEVVPRGHIQPLQGKKCLYRGWEPIFTLYKPPEPDFDPLSIGVPFADKSNLKRGDRGKNGDLRCRGDTWWLPYETTGPTKKKKHKHAYPIALVEFCLKVGAARPGDTVFEPFLGSGTTPVVAKSFGCHSVGIDRVAMQVKDADARWHAA